MVSICVMSTDHRPAIRPPVYLAVPVVQPEPVHHLLERRQGRRRQPRRLCRYMCRDMCARVNYLMSICKGYLNTPNKWPRTEERPLLLPPRLLLLRGAQQKLSTDPRLEARVVVPALEACVCVCVCLVGETRKAPSIHPSIRIPIHTPTHSPPRWVNAAAHLARGYPARGRGAGSRPAPAWCEAGGGSAAILGTARGPAADLPPLAGWATDS